jgi:hypothetical protein
VVRNRAAKLLSLGKVRLVIKAEVVRVIAAHRRLCMTQSHTAVIS